MSGTADGAKRHLPRFLRSADANLAGAALVSCHAAGSAASRRHAAALHHSPHPRHARPRRTRASHARILRTRRLLNRASRHTRKYFFAGPTPTTNKPRTTDLGLLSARLLDTSHGSRNGA